MESVCEMVTGDWNGKDPSFPAYREDDLEGVLVFQYRGRIVHDNVYPVNEWTPDRVLAELPAWAKAGIRYSAAS